MGDETSIEMADFRFSGLQKCRITTADKITSCFPSVAVSSQAQLVVTCTGRSELTACPSNLIHDLRVNKENVNTEFKDLPKKTISIENIEEITSIGISCDGKILGALVTTSSGCFVYLFDIRVFFQTYSGPSTHFCTVRLGNESSARGVALEWNPTIADVFAASASDKSVIVCSVSLEDPKIYKLLGMKQFTDVITIISWSPKGKQLTAADSAGNIVQLKPELEIVRKTPVIEGLPIAAPSSSLTICGLCWLATTDWLVSFSEAGKSDTYSFLLKILKNKPPQWILLPDLQYGNPSSKFPPRIFTASHLLVHWNLVLICNSKTSEITVIGRTGEDWKVWSLDDCDRFDLPTNADMGDTFPVGMALDVSSSKTVILEDSATKTHRPSPILMVLNSDGVLASSHVILDLGVSDVQVKPDILGPNGVVIGNSQPSIASGEKFHSEKANSLFSTAPASNSLFPKTPGPSVGTSIFGGSATPSLAAPTATTTNLGFGTPTFGKGSALSSLLTDAPKTSAPSTAMSSNTPAFGMTASSSVAPTTIPSTPLFSKPTGGLFPQTTATSTASPNPISKPAPKQVVSPQKSLASVDSIEPTKAATDPVLAPAVKDNKAEVEKARKSFMTVYNKMKEELKGLEEDIGIVHTGLQKTKPIITESEHDIEGQEVVLEMIKTNSQLEETMSSLEKQLKEAFATAAEKSDIAEMFRDDKTLLKRLKETDDFDREERMKRLVINMDSLKEKYADAKKLLDQAKKQQVSKTAHLLPSAIGADDLIHKQVKAINKAMTALRFRLDTVEDDIKHVTQVSKKLEMKKQGKTTDKKLMAVNILKVQPVPTPSGDIEEMRKKMAAICLAKLKNPPKLRRIIALPFINEPQTSQNPGTTPSTITSLKKDHVEKPRSVVKPAVHMSDAATQADMVLQTSTPKAVKQPETPMSSNFGSSIATPNLLNSMNKPLTSSTPLSKVFSGTNTVSAGTSTLPILTSASNIDTKKDNATQGSQTTVDSSKALAAKPFSFGAPTGGLSLFGGPSNQAPGTPNANSLFGKKETTEKPADKVDLNSTSSMFGKSPIKVEEDKKIEKPSEGDKNANESLFTPKTEPPVEPAKDTKEDQKKDDTTAPASGEVGASSEQKSSVFGGNASKPASIFGGATSDSSKSTSLFGSSSKETPKTSIFGGASTSVASTTPSVFGASASSASTAPSIFGASTSTAPAKSSVFGASTTTSSTTPSVFGAASSASSTTPSVFGASTTTSTAPSVFGGSTTTVSTASSVFGGSTTTPAATSSVFGGSTAAPAATSSVFGSSTTAASTTTSVFGATATPAASSPFGSFGKTEPAQSTTASAFSFKNTQSSSTPAAANPSGFSFNKPSLGGGSNMGFAAAAAKAAQEGMMEDDMGDGSGANKPSGFGNAFGSLSFGSSKPADSSKNVFGSVNQSATNKEGWLFKKDANVSFSAQQPQQTNQSFGSFGGGQTGSVFGGAQQSASASSSSAFGGAPKFGGNPSFGAKPVFGGGASPFGSSPSKGGSVFGGGASSGGGFAAFANNAPGFGAGQAPSAGASIFGGGSSQPAQQPSASVFGGSQNKNSFNTWR